MTEYTPLQRGKLLKALSGAHEEVWTHVRLGENAHREGAIAAAADEERAANYWLAVAQHLRQCAGMKS